MGVPQHKHTGCCLVLTLILRRGLVRFHKVQALPYISNALLVQRVFSDVQMVAEFAIRYALDVHRAWAAGGLAPRLLHTEVSNSTDPLQLVIMEWLPETYRTLDQLIQTAADS